MPSRGTYPAFTFGLEIEVEHFPVENIANKLRDLGFGTRHDASVLSNGQIMLGRPVYMVNNTGLPSHKVTFGGEFASEPIVPEYEGWGEKVSKALKLLSLDDLHDSERSGIHVHVNVSNTLTTEQLKSIIRWGTRLEAPLYRIGAFKGKHRGESNNYNYCRPICDEGPACVPTGKGFGQVFSTYDLVTSDRKYYEFWQAYGDLMNSDWQYHPVRYHWLNLKPILNQGTLEFRLFNQTFDPYYIEAIIALSQAIAYTMLTVSSYKDIDSLGFAAINSIYNPAGEQNDRNLLDFIINHGSQFFDQCTATTVLKLFSDGVYQKIKPGYTYSHMVEKREFRLFTNKEAYIPTAIPSSEIRPAVYVDSHNIQQTGNDPANILNLLKKRAKDFKKSAKTREEAAISFTAYLENMREEISPNTLRVSSSNSTRMYMPPIPEPVFEEDLIPDYFDEEEEEEE